MLAEGVHVCQSQSCVVRMWECILAVRDGGRQTVCSERCRVNQQGTEDVVEAGDGFERGISNSRVAL
jgi:hypothetical protein